MKDCRDFAINIHVFDKAYAKIQTSTLSYKC